MEFIPFIQLAVISALAVMMFNLNNRVRDLEMDMDEVDSDLDSLDMDLDRDFDRIEENMEREFSRLENRVNAVQA